jgi:hypothetical protein
MSEIVTLNDNGAWCWYQDERVLIDPTNNTMLVGSIAAAEGLGGPGRSGNVELALVDLTTRKTRQIVVLHERFEADDHDVPALYLRPDGRYLAVYSRHKTDNFTFWRISENPHDATSWRPVQTFDWTQLVAGRKVTYQNLHYLPAEGRLYNFVRAINDDPSILISDDHGDTWRFGGKVLTIPKVGYVNAYMRYASNGVDRIDFICTEHHPRNFNNSIYHGYIKGGMLHRSDGHVVDSHVLDPNAPPQTLLTKVFAADTVVDGDLMTRAWTVDLRLDSAGHPVGIISCRANDVPQAGNVDPKAGIRNSRADEAPAEVYSDDRRLFYIRFDGHAWHVHQLAKAGPGLLPHEQDYTGLGAVDPADTNRVYISTPIHPATGQTLKVHEIFRGVTRDGGASWQWTQLTHDSPVANLRPIVPKGADGKIVLWFRGTMTASQHYKCEVVGAFDP